MSSRHPIRKRQQHCSEHPSVRKHYILPQLRLLAPKAKTPLLPPVQQRLQLERNKIWDVQDTETPTDAPASVKPQHLATSQSISFGHDFTSPQPLFPDSTVTSLEEKQHAVVTSSTDTYSSRMPLTSPDVGFPEFTPVNLLSGVVIHESHGISTHHLPYSSLQFQETIHNQYGGNYCTPRLNTPEVWTSMTKPTIDISQDQSSQYTIDQHPPLSNQPLPAIQPAQHTLLPQNWQHVLCANCPLIWCLHLESIMFSDPEDKGISNLKRSYRDLRQHIHEAHQWHYGASCSLCENLFCYHLEKMMLLEVVKGDLSEVKIDLQSSFTTLRDHIQEAHGGC